MIEKEDTAHPDLWGAAVCAWGEPVVVSDCLRKIISNR